MTTYIVNLFILGAAVWISVASGRGLRLVTGDLKALLRKPLWTLLLVGTCAAPIGIARVLITPYWAVGAWEGITVPETGQGSDGGHWAGAAHPTVTVVEYTDYECPYCRTAHKKLRALLEKYTDQVRVVHRHFPLDNACNPMVTRPFHARACEFSKAVVCAGRQGRFWEMNDAIFSAQDKVRAANVDLQKFALQLGLDRSEFTECVAGDEALEEIHGDIEMGRMAGVRATPTFVIDGKMFTGRLTEEQLQELLAR